MSKTSRVTWKFRVPTTKAQRQLTWAADENCLFILSPRWHFVFCVRNKTLIDCQFGPWKVYQYSSKQLQAWTQTSSPKVPCVFGIPWSTFRKCAKFPVKMKIASITNRKLDMSDIKQAENYNVYLITCCQFDDTRTWQSEKIQFGPKMFTKAWRVGE